jgi:hypothetical protein
MAHDEVGRAGRGPEPGKLTGEGAAEAEAGKAVIRRRRGDGNPGTSAPTISVRMKK